MQNPCLELGPTSLACLSDDDSTVMVDTDGKTVKIGIIRESKKQYTTTTSSIYLTSAEFEALKRVCARMT